MDVRYEMNYTQLVRMKAQTRYFVGEVIEIYIELLKKKKPFLGLSGESTVACVRDADALFFRFGHRFSKENSHSLLIYFTFSYQAFAG